MDVDGSYSSFGSHLCMEYYCNLPRSKQRRPGITCWKQMALVCTKQKGIKLILLPVSRRLHLHPARSVDPCTTFQRKYLQGALFKFSICTKNQEPTTTNRSSHFLIKLFSSAKGSNPSISCQATRNITTPSDRLYFCLMHRSARHTRK